MADADASLATRFPVDWQSMTMANLIDQDECSSVQRFQRMPTDEIQDHINSEPDAARELGRALVRLVRVTGNATGVGLACALSSIVLSGGPTRVDLFKEADDTVPVQEFVRVLTADGPGEGSTQLDASRAIAAFLSAASPSQLGTFSFDPVLKWLNDNIRHAAAIAPHNVSALRCAGALFRSRDFRLQFLASPGMDLLCDYITQKADQGLTADVLYRATFCLWSLSYHDEAVSAVCAHNIVLHLISRNLPHIDDKISRLGLSTLVNLLNKEDAEQGVQLNDVMVESNIGKALVDMEVRKWTVKDQKDVEEDIGRLRKVLRSKFQSMNSFERYMAELTSGHLKAGAMHTDKFWSENASKFEHKDFLAIRLLVDLLSSDDKSSVVLACQDLGEFARFYDGGKKIIQHYNGKLQIMKLMENEDRDIQKAALLSSAKLLINNWEHV